MLMEVAQHVSHTMTRRLNPARTHALHREQLAAVEALARSIPAYVLHISLSGTFWEEIEQALQNNEKYPTRHVSHITHCVSRFAQPTPTDSLFADAPILVAYSGPSMNPTLREPDLLEVAPYDGHPLQIGDVIYFEPPEGEREIVHRVVCVTPDGIRTRGDNNPDDDPYFLQTTDVIGRVVAAQRGSRKRRVAGGRRGALLGYVAHKWRVVNRSVSQLLHNTYQTLAGRGFFRRLLPRRLYPRLLVFQSWQGPTRKLMMGQREVGRYDNWRRQWIIQRPFRLFVDETRLPVFPLPTIDHPPSTADEHLV